MKMKHHLSLLLALLTLLALPLTALAETPFTLRNGYYWGMTKEAALALVEEEGIGPDTSKGPSVIALQNVPFGNATASQMLLAFDTEALTLNRVIYSIGSVPEDHDDELIALFNSLVQTLTDLYGAPDDTMSHISALWHLPNVEISVVVANNRNEEGRKQYSITLKPPERKLEDSGYESGQYKAGVDLPAGEYVLLATSNYGGYFSVSLDANGNHILFNDNFETNSIITVERGDYVELSRCVAFLAGIFYQDYSIKEGMSGVMLKVGRGYDIAPGEYRLKADEGGYGGYYCIYTDSRRSDIIANDNFDNTAYVSVADGQYLLLSRCSIQ